MTVVYDEIIDFLAAGTTPDTLVAFQPSESTRNQVGELIRKQKAGEITPAEESQLTYFLQLEHLMRLTKARARKHLPENQPSCP